MNCPHCGGETYVVDSRPNEDSTYRRRECENCKRRFSTVEIDADYYKALKPIDKEAVRKALLDGYTKVKAGVCSALGIKEMAGMDEDN